METLIRTTREGMGASASARSPRGTVDRRRRTREVELTKTIQAIGKGDQLLSIPAHTLLFRARLGTMPLAGLGVAAGRWFEPRGPAMGASRRQNNSPRCRW